MIMKKEARRRVLNFTARLLPVVISLCIATPSQPAQAASKSTDGLPPEIQSFIKDKEAHARDLAKKLEIDVSPDVWAYFGTAQTGQLAATTNAFERLKKRSSQYEGSSDDPTVGTPVWQVAVEVELAVEAFVANDSRYSAAFGQGVIQSVPAGSIYFGGTDPGRGLPTAYSKSHAKGDPFFTITQNALADARYLDYIRATYGDILRTPTAEDSRKTFSEYLADAQKRLDHDRRRPNEPRQIKPGEDVRIVNNRVTVSGQVAVMAINGLLCKVIFDANPDREFYIEESFPLDWMYPHLTPHELIFKLNRKPLAALPNDVVKKDREFWIRQQTQMIGGWLKPKTTVKEVCDFASKTFGRKDYSRFKGDRGFVENGYAHKLYSKLRSSAGGLYTWRAQNATDPAEKKQMLAEADFAFRQAFALCPYSPEAIYRYVNLLVGAERLDDASRITTAARTLMPGDRQLENLDTELERLKRAKKK